MWNIPSQGSGGRVLPLFWRIFFVFPSISPSREFFPPSKTFPSLFTLVFEKKRRRNSEGADIRPCEKEPLLLLICTFSSSRRIARVYFWRKDFVYFSEVYRSFDKSTALFVECRISLQTPHSTLHTSHPTLYTLDSRLHSTLYTRHSTLPTLDSTL